MNAVDTNILIYVNDNRDLVKQGIAAALVSSLRDGVLLWQVACEQLRTPYPQPLGLLQKLTRPTIDSQRRSG